MFKAAALSDTHARAGTPLPPRSVSRIPVVALGLSLGSFLTLTFVLCVLFDLWFPGLSMNPVWAPLLPGFTWITWGSFGLGLIETFAYGWYVALIFGPLYNFFAAKVR
ncbi:MAG: hypothetical protein RH942_12230 [Kiloniellaceae bacterium]